MEELEKYIAGNRDRLLALARKLDVSESTIYRWLRGEAMPSPATRRRIERATKGAVKGWTV